MTKQNTAKAAQPATDLRQRVARARDAAGRFIKRSASVEPPAPPPEPDLAAELQPHPDAALFALGGQFMAAWVAEDAVEVAEMAIEAEEEAADWRAYQECKRIAEQIVRTPATTAAGYGIKALLLARYDSENSGPSRPIAPQGSFASDWNVLRQVQEGAARLAASDTGIAMSAAAEPETGILASAVLTGAALLDLLDLTSATMEDLQSLHDIADLVGGVAYAMVWTGRCKARGSGDEYNAAGKLMQWLGDALSDVESAANNEARRRASLSRLDRETRLEMLALPVIQNGDPNDLEAFARELLDHAAAERRGH